MTLNQKMNKTVFQQYVLSYSHIIHMTFAPVTLTSIYKVDLDVVKMYLYTKNEVSRQRLSEVRAQMGQTDRRDQIQYHTTFVGNYHVH